MHDIFLFPDECNSEAMGDSSVEATAAAVATATATGDIGLAPHIGDGRCCGVFCYVTDDIMLERERRNQDILPQNDY